MTYRVSCTFFYLLLAGTLFAQTTSRTITGRAISADDSTGIGGLTVAYTQANGITHTTTTDSLGFYSLDNITAVDRTENQTPLQVRTGVWNNPSSAPVFGYTTPAASFVTIKVYDVLGREVKTLWDQPVEAGTHAVQWDGKNNRSALVSNGVYFISMVVGNKIAATEKVAFDRGAPQGTAHTAFSMPRATGSLQKTAGVEVIAFSDSVKKRFTTYIDSAVAPAITKYDVPLILDIKLDCPIGSNILTLLQLFQVEQYIDFGLTSNLSPLYPIQLNLDSTGTMPKNTSTNWYERLTKGIQISNEDNIRIEEVKTKYTGSDRTYVKVAYYSNDEPPLFGKDGTITIDKRTADGRPLEATIYIRGSLSNDQITYVLIHELYRIRDNRGRDLPLDLATAPFYRMFYTTKPGPDESFNSISKNENQFLNLITNIPPTIYLPNYKPEWK